MRKLTVLGALLACAPLAFAAGAPALPERGGSSHVTGLDDANSPSAPNGVTSRKAGRATDRAVAGGSGKNGVSKTRDREPAAVPRRGAVVPQHAARQVARGNADRLHSLLNAQARGRLASVIERPATNPRMAARDSIIGGPHSQVSGRLGGPVIARTAHTATINGTQLHHKY